MEKVKNTSMNPIQHSASRRVRPARSSGLNDSLATAGKVHAPGKQPDQVKQPEPDPRHGVVVARIAQIQEAQQLLVDEEEPEETVILARPAVHGEREVRRIAQRGQHMPGHRDQQNDRQPAEGMQPLPGLRAKTIAWSGTGR